MAPPDPGAVTGERAAESLFVLRWWYRSPRSADKASLSAWWKRRNAPVADSSVDSMRKFAAEPRANLVSCSMLI